MRCLGTFKGVKQSTCAAILFMACAGQALAAKPTAKAAASAMPMAKIAATPATPPSGAMEYVLDKDHSKVEFEVSHLVFSSVTGIFRDFDGTFHFDEKNFGKTDLNAAAKTATVFTDSDKRDKHLAGPDFFDAEKFPKLTFKSKSVKNIGDKSFQLVGDLTIHGVTKEVAFDVKYLGAVMAFGKHRVGFKGETKIVRQDFGMNFSTVADSVPLVGDEVTIRVTAQGILKSDL